MNDPKNVLQAELETKTAELAEVKKDIKKDPDPRYRRRKELGTAVMQLKEALMEAMSSDDEVELGPPNKRRRYRRGVKERVKFNKERVHDHCRKNNLSPEEYDAANREEITALRPI